jgi:four helix bundle protein
VRRKHHQLLAWQQAIVLVKSVYEATAKFPKEELYLLTSQMRRCAVSVPSNIAEGAARSGSREFLQFLGIARGSLSELETQVLIAKELGYLKNYDALAEQIDSVFRLLGGLINSLRKTPSS